MQRCVKKWLKANSTGKEVAGVPSPSTTLPPSPVPLDPLCSTVPHLAALTVEPAVPMVKDV